LWFPRTTFGGAGKPFFKIVIGKLVLFASLWWCGETIFEIVIGKLVLFASFLRSGKTILR
jgi:hypothetical protein